MNRVFKFLLTFLVVACVFAIAFCVIRICTRPAAKVADAPQSESVAVDVSSEQVYDFTPIDVTDRLSELTDYLYANDLVDNDHPVDLNIDSDNNIFYVKNDYRVSVTDTDGIFSAVVYNNFDIPIFIMSESVADTSQFKSKDEIKKKFQPMSDYLLEVLGQVAYIKTFGYMPNGDARLVISVGSGREYSCIAYYDAAKDQCSAEVYDLKAMSSDPIASWFEGEDIHENT